MIRKLTSISAAVAFLLPFGAQAGAPAGAFLADAIQGDNAEVKLGELAQSHAASPKVREFGATLERDHAKSRGIAMALAGKERVRAPAGLKPEAKAMYDKLEAMHGAEFDRAFVHHMVQDHRKDIAKFEAQAKSRDAVTARFAKATLPTLKQHLAIAQSLD